MPPDVVAAIRGSLALVLLLAALSKVASPQPVVSAIVAARVFPMKAHVAVVYLVALAEAAAAAALVDRNGYVGIVFAGLVLVAFSAFLLLLARRAPAVPCGCFGDIVDVGHTGALVRNGTLLLLLACAATGEYAGPALGSLPAAIELTIAVVLVPDATQTIVNLRNRSEVA
jgi:hypothetical protein